MQKSIKIVMFKKLSHFFQKIIFVIGILLLLLLPLINFKINMESEIFPSIEIILVYYFSTNYQIKSWQIFIIGFLFDQLYSMPTGSNSLTFLLGNLGLKYVREWFLLKIYSINFIGFCGYCLFILSFRYFIFVGYNIDITNILIIFFQYLTTIFSYSLVRIPLDNSLKYFRKHAK